mgnify:CR=1 FL=1
MHRYGNIEFLFTLNFDDLLNMYIKAKKENATEQLWQQFLVDYSRMDKEQFTSFEDYKIKAFGIKIENNNDVDKIISEAELIKQADQRNKST